MGMRTLTTEYSLGITKWIVRSAIDRQLVGVPWGASVRYDLGSGATIAHLPPQLQSRYCKCPAQPAICRRGIPFTSRSGATAVSFWLPRDWEGMCCSQCSPKHKPRCRTGCMRCVWWQITYTSLSDLMMPLNFPVWCTGWVGIQQWHSTALLGVAGTSGRQGITPLPLPPKTIEGCWIPSGISTPIPKQQEWERVFMTPIPTTGTTAGWRLMASVNGTPFSLIVDPRAK